MNVVLNNRRDECLVFATLMYYAGVEAAQKFVDDVQMERPTTEEVNSYIHDAGWHDDTCCKYRKTIAYSIHREGDAF